MDPSLEKFGEFLIQNLRDRMLYDLGMILRGGWKSPDTQDLQKGIARLSDVDKEMIRELAEHITTTGMHDLLFAIQEEADADGAIRLLVDGKEVAKLSDGLHGEIFGEEGWIARFSEYPSRAQSELSSWAKDQIQDIFGNDNEQEG